MKALTITSLIFCLLGFTFVLILESYTYPGFWQNNFFVSFAVLVYATLGISSFITLYAVKKYQSETAKIIFSLTLPAIYLLLWITTIFNKGLVVVSDGNLEILYGWYHFDIRVINQAQRLIPPFFAVIAILFFRDIFSLIKVALAIAGVLLRWGGFIIFNIWQYFKVPQHKNQALNLLKYWDMALFFISLLFFWHQQSIFPNKSPDIQFIIRIMGGYTALGMVIKQKKKVTLPLIGSVFIWALISFFHFHKIFISIRAFLLMSVLPLVFMIGLYLLRPGRTKHD
ncbi:hypothetical protein A2160_02770 [Candidatus Beckwithbacteria bacterium RBG_13_42_9]|uniref:Uncharacterized protein n=1 Tax=Candidatus Beckwithbacteria bacterium RBG_13_42_9 TaxID=1797457 RepID=A0A1F5E7Q5_9BACT|nr:MAG: hypothetical protein A2160_02770 [Candidatus Beckwithbacteria bacterium RBG_13_42_9]